MGDYDFDKAIKKGIRDAKNERAAESFAGTSCGCWIIVIWLLIMIAIVVSIVHSKSTKIDMEIILGFIVTAVCGLLFKIGTWFDQSR